MRSARLNIVLNSPAFSHFSAAYGNFLTRDARACYTVKPAVISLALRSRMVAAGGYAGCDLRDVTEETTQLVLPSRFDSVADAAALAAEVVSRNGFEENVAFGVDMAVREAVANAIKHGNLQDESKHVEVTFTASEDALEVVVRDEGAGFDPTAIADPTDTENLLKSSGRGIFFMRNFMDEVEWSNHPDGGTVVHMTKRR